MLTPEQIEGFRLAAGRLIDPINTYLLKDIARRIQDAGKLTSTAAYEAWRAEWLGKDRKELERDLAQLLGVTRGEARKLLRTAARYGYDTTLSRYPGHLIPFDANPAIQQIVSAAVTLAGDELKNITQTKAIMLMDPYGQYQTLPKAYMACTDYAFQQVFTGAADYNTAIRRACSGIVKHGVSVAYASGVHTGLEAAVRRNIMGGLGLMTEQISQQNHDALGCNGWEISAHANSAPDHEPIQGLQYSDAAYEELNNSLVRRIGTLNCGHVASPIILGVTRPQYTAAELEQFRQDNEKGVTFEGRHYTGYEATQMQRRMERAIRAQKRRVLLAGPEDAAPRKGRLVLLQQEYHRFSDGVGLRTEGERLEVSGFGPKQMKQLPLEKPASSTALTPGAIKPPKSERFVDITGNWYPDAKPNSHPVLEQQEYTFNGVTYKVDGHNVVLDHDAHEKEIAELLEREVGGEIYLVPRVNNPQGVPTPDYLFHGRGYDLKTLSEKAGPNTMFQRVKKAKRQSRNFIIDVSNTKLDRETIAQQISKIFWSENTRFVDEIVIINDGRIVQVAKRA
uniref:Minor capsid protein n=1 Tax=Siphoviridae sp. ctwDU14 TaxID=2825726 RepID=A0A8S5PGV9_9CAUD|nr:MAG TPA: minor capsid protein [Siphoviridae sp. ctwDU14]